MSRKILRALLFLITVLAIAAIQIFLTRIYQAQHAPALQGNNQLINALLSIGDMPVTYFFDGQNIKLNTLSPCRGETYYRSFRNLPHPEVAVVHTTQLCANEEQTVALMKDIELSFNANAKNISLEHILIGQKPKNASGFFAVCYEFNGIKSCQTSARYGRFVSLVTVNFGWSGPFVTRDTLINWTFGRNDELLGRSY